MGMRVYRGLDNFSVMVRWGLWGCRAVRGVIRGYRGQDIKSSMSRRALGMCCESSGCMRGTPMVYKIRSPRVGACGGVFW